MKKNQTPEESKQEIKLGTRISKELNSAIYYHLIADVMNKIENIRKQRLTISPVYTQEYVAKRADVSLSTYKSYLNDSNDNIRLKTLWKIADALEVELTDILGSANTKDKQN